MLLAMGSCEKRDKPGDSDGGDGGISAPATGSQGGNGGSSGAGTASTQGSGLANDIPGQSDGTNTNTGGVGEVCASKDIDLKQKPTKLMLVLDKSRSMVDNSWDHDNDVNSAPVTRWSSLYDVVKQVTEKFTSTISFGAQLYPSKNPPEGGLKSCAVDATPEVAIAEGSGPAIMAALPPKNSGTEQVSGATPTYAAYESALAHLLSVKNAAGETNEQPPAIVLVTDGAANCGSLDNVECKPKMGQILAPNDPCVKKWFIDYDDRIHAAVKKAYEDHGIKTYVIGIGIDKTVSEANAEPTIHERLNQLSGEGETARPDPTTKYFSADNQNSLLSALDEIAASVQTCEVDLKDAVAESRKNYVEIKVGNKVVPPLLNADSCDGKVGWRWNNSKVKNRIVELCGTACDDLKTVAKVDVVVGCEPPG